MRRGATSSSREAGLPGERAAPPLAVYTTWYPGVERFLPDWADSLTKQTDRRFDVWIGVDGLDAAREARALGNLQEVNWFVADHGDTPAEVRGKALSRFIDRYPAVIFVDSDDILMPSRVAAARAALEAHDVVACALRIVDEKGHDLGLVFGQGEGRDWSRLLPRHNVFGLSNSAFRSDVLKQILPIPRDCILIDWLLATRAWIAGRDLFFDDEPRMAYRQYGENVAHVLPPFSPADVLRATERVRLHYRLLLDDPFRAVPDPFRSALSAARDRVITFERFLSASEANLARYVEALNRLAPRYVWWWAVANPELESVWKS